MTATTAGHLNAITDIPGIRVGNATRTHNGALTGTTVVLLPPGTLATADVRGGAPATRETTALDPRYGGREVPAIVLTGGSSYGLSAADGVQTWLGTPTPLVPAAALFDLGRGGNFTLHPDPTLGMEAAEAAKTANPHFPTGNAGAGTGAVNAGLKGGLGTASAVLPDGTVIAALAALNAVGTSVDPDTGLPHAASTGVHHRWRDGEPVAWQEFPTAGGDDLTAARSHLMPSNPSTPSNPLNTVIGVIATNARLTPAQLFRLANSAHDGLALAVRPAHGLFDGDTVFAVATGTEDTDAEAVVAAGAEVFARALVHGLLAAESVTTGWRHVPAYRELYPRTAASYQARW
ncbi:P1 family peptidase [Umezawaea tangerina]|uniref:Putative pantetheine hydrolase n=1 Tax=Umezawaea tangerina TaxID=84725 RepID=A0A2T0SXC2_9PSEU|nr:P1 family peptidase [Umezawaea tangerina]PRY38074.1 putative pantetheine hydrolase [Umezawaea tangerina]